MMQNEPEAAWFEEVETVVSEPIKFKYKLAIGEDAYTSLRLKKAALEVWDVAGVGSTAVAVAQSSAVASSFFAPSGLMGLLGIGTAVTPIGWVAAVGVLSCGTYVGVTRYLKRNTPSRATSIPDFINTPMDVLAMGIFDLLAPLALKIADAENLGNGAIAK